MVVGIHDTDKVNQFEFFVYGELQMSEDAKTWYMHPFEIIPSRGDYYMSYVCARQREVYIHNFCLYSIFHLLQYAIPHNNIRLHRTNTSR